MPPSIKSDITNGHHSIHKIDVSGSSISSIIPSRAQAKVSIRTGELLGCSASTLADDPAVSPRYALESYSSFYNTASGSDLLPNCVNKQNRGDYGAHPDAFVPELTE